jgi:hypothetical protein
VRWNLSGISHTRLIWRTPVPAVRLALSSVLRVPQKQPTHHNDDDKEQKQQQEEP